MEETRYEDRYLKYEISDGRSVVSGSLTRVTSLHGLRSWGTEGAEEGKVAINLVER